MNCEKKIRKACRIKGRIGQSCEKKTYDSIESLSNTTNRNESSELAKTNVKLTKLYNNGPSRMTVGWSIPAKLSGNDDAKGEKRNYDTYDT
jgi:hypothetical protein